MKCLSSYNGRSCSAFFSVLVLLAGFGSQTWGQDQKSPPLSSQSPTTEQPQPQPDQSTAPIFKLLRDDLLTLKDRLQTQSSQADEQASSSATTGDKLNQSSNQAQSSLDQSAKDTQGTSTSLTGASDTLTNSKQDLDAYKLANDKTVKDQAEEIALLKKEKWLAFLEGTGTGAAIVAVAWIATALLAHK